MGHFNQTLCHKDDWYGKCCCSCRHLLSLCQHPWNKWEEARGRVTEVFAYACAHPELNYHPEEGRRSAVFFERSHGLCEGYEPR